MNKKDFKNDELKEIRGYKKDMLYPDRCMLKWQGMMLSDHSEALFDKAKEREKAVEKPRKMGRFGVTLKKGTLLGQ